MINLDTLRDGQIRVHHLGQTDSAYTFYYDETNNVRKLYVDEDGFNVALPKIFVLGGIAHEGVVRAIDISSLRQAMKVQKNVRELKLAYVAKGEFVDLLKSEKLTIFLRWIRDNGFVIHYHEFDPLYWSVGRHRRLDTCEKRPSDAASLSCAPEERSNSSLQKQSEGDCRPLSSIWLPRPVR